MQNLTFEYVSCNGCGSNQTQLLFTGPDYLLDINTSFKLVRCSHCGLIRQNPRLTWESLSKFYPVNYDAFDKQISSETSWIRRLDRRYGMSKRIHSIKKYSPEGRLLDIGCGTGIFLAEAQQYGNWELAGIEPSTKASSHVTDTLGIPVDNTRFEDTRYPPSSFNIISMWNVLEHLAFPVEAISQVAELLMPGGLFIFTIPKVESIEARVFKKYWVGWDLPRHLYLFPLPILRMILDSSGFDVLQEISLAGSHFSFCLSLEFFLKSRSISRKTISRVINLAKSMPLRILTFPAFFLIDHIGYGPQITIFAKKREAN